MLSIFEFYLNRTLHTFLTIFSLLLMCYLNTSVRAQSSVTYTGFTGLGSPGYGGTVWSMGFTPDSKVLALIQDVGLYASSTNGQNWSALGSGINYPDQRALAIDSTAYSTSNPYYNVYIGTEGGGVFLSTNSGLNFSQVNNGLGCTYVRTLITVGTRVLMGTDAKGVYPGVVACSDSTNGVYYSDNKGAKWTQATGLPSGILVYTINNVTDASGTSYLFASTNNGIYKSTDTGNTWVALPTSPSGPNGARIYKTGLNWTTSSTGTTYYYVATVEGAGVYVSTDGGNTWMPRNNGLPITVMSSSVTQFTGGIWYAAIEGNGIYTSSNLGVSWTQFATESQVPSARYITKSGNNFYVTTFAGIYVSSDSGQTWSQPGSGLPSSFAINASTTSDGTLYLGTADGVYQQSNTGSTDTPTFVKLTGVPPLITSGQIKAAGTSVFASTAYEGIFKLNSDKSSFQAFNTGLPSNLIQQCPVVRVDTSVTPNQYYAALYGAGFYYYDNNNSTWVARNSGLSGNALKIYSFNFTGTNFIISTDAGVYVSSNAGQTWTASGLKDGSGALLLADRVQVDTVQSNVMRATVRQTSSLGVPSSMDGIWTSVDSGVTWNIIQSSAGTLQHLITDVVPSVGEMIVGSYYNTESYKGDAYWTMDIGQTIHPITGGSMQRFFSAILWNNQIIFGSSNGFYPYNISNIVSLPSPPTIGTAVAGNASASVAFTAPSSTAGISGYEIVSNPGGLVATGSTSPIPISGLTNGTSYNFTVAAINTSGVSAYSAASNTVTPSAQASTTYQTTTTISNTTSTTQTNANSGSGQNTSFNIVSGWNLLGNGSSQAFNVASVFGDSTKFISVWKWLASQGIWAFYSPNLNATTLSNYANLHGYQVLTTINSGDGFWVDAVTSSTLNVTFDSNTSLVNSSSYQSGSNNALPSGWSLIATGDNLTPKQFNSSLSTTPPSVGSGNPINVISLWAWDSANSNWYFYAPSLDNSSTLNSYISSKNYESFNNLTLTPETGFWVNVP